MIVVFTHCWTMESKLMYCVHLFIFIIFHCIQFDNFFLILQFHLLPSFLFFNFQRSHNKYRGVEVVLSDGEREFLLWMLMWKLVALILCFLDELLVRFLWSSTPLAFDDEVLHLITEHTKWQSDKEISSGWLPIVTVLREIPVISFGNSAGRV